MPIKQAVPVLRVADVARSMAWYCEALGFIGDPFPDRAPYDFAILRHGRTEIMLRHGTSTAQPTPKQYDWDVYLRLIDAPFRKIFNLLGDRNGVINRPLQVMPYGLTEFEIVDPDGYVICLSQLLDDTSDLPTARG